MSVYFTVDRMWTLRSGMVLQLEDYSSFVPASATSRLLALFPAGLSFHGRRYLLQPPPANPPDVLSYQIEMAFELARRASFGSTPSRFESLFAFDTADIARAFVRGTPHANAPIFEVHGEPFLRADMRLLNTNGQPGLEAWRMADDYWSGRPGRDPLWENLFRLPLTIGPLVPP